VHTQAELADHLRRAAQILHMRAIESDSRA